MYVHQLFYVAFDDLTNFRLLGCQTDPEDFREGILDIA